MTIVIDTATGLNKVSINLDDLIIHHLNTAKPASLGFVYSLIAHLKYVDKFDGFISEPVYLSLRKGVRKFWDELAPMYKDFFTNFYDNPRAARSSDYPSTLNTVLQTWRNRFKSEYFDQDSMSRMYML